MADDNYFEDFKKDLTLLYTSCCLQHSNRIDIHVAWCNTGFFYVREVNSPAQWDEVISEGAFHFDVMFLQFPHFHSRSISFIVQLFHERKIRNALLEIILPNCARIVYRGGFLAPKVHLQKKWTLNLHFLLWIKIETLNYCMTLHKCKKIESCRSYIQSQQLGIFRKEWNLI